MLEHPCDKQQTRRHVFSTLLPSGEVVPIRKRKKRNNEMLKKPWMIFNDDPEILKIMDFKTEQENSFNISG